MWKHCDPILIGDDVLYPHNLPWSVAHKPTQSSYFATKTVKQARGWVVGRVAQQDDRGSKRDKAPIIGGYLIFDLKGTRTYHFEVVSSGYENRTGPKVLNINVTTKLQQLHK